MNKAAEQLKKSIAPWVSALKPDELIMQIGACIGGTPPHDTIDPVYGPLIRLGCPAVLVEPQEPEMAQCFSFYKSKCSPEAFERIFFATAALSDHDGFTSFTVRGGDNDGPKGLSTLSMDRGFLKEYEKNAKTVEVPCVTVARLLELAPSHNGWGWLQIDIEGHEAVAIRQIPNLVEKPRLVTFEHLHMTKSDREEAKRLLRHLGYSNIGWHTDDAAYVKN